MGTNSVLKIPASRHRLEATAPKFDTQAYVEDDLPPGSSGRHGGSNGLSCPTFVSSLNDSNLLKGSLYPDAALSEYLPRCKVWGRSTRGAIEDQSWGFDMSG